MLDVVASSPSGVVEPAPTVQQHSQQQLTTEMATDATVARTIADLQNFQSLKSEHQIDDQRQLKQNMTSPTSCTLETTDISPKWTTTTSEDGSELDRFDYDEIYDYELEQTETSPTAQDADGRLVKCEPESPSARTRRHDNEIANNRHHHNHPYHRSTHNRPHATDRIDLKLTDAQVDKLSSLIKIIRNGVYEEFLELLDDETRGFKNLLNVFVDGQTALHYSLIYGRSLAWCKRLVVNGANPNLTNRAGWHPIHLAAFNGSRETMRYLIDCIAN